MKTKLTTALLLAISITGCQKQPEESDLTISSGKESTDVIQFELADQKIGEFLNQLDNPQTSVAKRQQIICKDYSAIYFNEYVPSLMKLSQEYTVEQLKQDLELALDFYKEKDQVSC